MKNEGLEEIAQYHDRMAAESRAWAEAFPGRKEPYEADVLKHKRYANAIRATLSEPDALAKPAVHIASFEAGQKAARSEASIRAYEEREASLVQARDALAAECERLREALEKAEAQFRWYAELHRSKGTQDGDRKAHANAQIADMCHEALEQP